MKQLINSISFKTALLFSTLFLVLLLLLGYLLYGAFSQIFIDYIIQDLLNRGENHAKVLTENYNQTTINHVGLMEKNVITNVIVTDRTGNIIVNSDVLDNDIIPYIGNIENENKVLNYDWRNSDYLVTVSPIKAGELGYVYMYYPASIIKDTVLIIKLFIGFASLGVILIAIGFIMILSKKMAKPLLTMKEATNKMAKGHYKQLLSLKGQDELAQLANSIQTLGEKLQYYEDSRNEFLANVSHELRTPLTYIKGYSDILVKGKIKDNTEIYKYLKIINDETKRITTLVEDLFELSKIKTGQFLLKKELVNLNGIVKKVINNLKPFAEEKGLNLTFHSKPGIPSVYIDPNRMYQVFFNLIENAIKYTNQGEVMISLSYEKQNVLISIRDTGIGIAKGEIEKIWEKFHRVEKSRAKVTGGTGLGLYVVKEIIMMHKGNIEIESIEGEGTTITIKLKREDEML